MPRFSTEVDLEIEVDEFYDKLDAEDKRYLLELLEKDNSLAKLANTISSLSQNELRELAYLLDDEQRQILIEALEFYAPRPA